MSAVAGVGDFGLQAILDETKGYRNETLNYVNGRFPQSLTVYVDGTSGDDARTGLTDNTNATTGRVKTLARVAALYSDKVAFLTVVITGTLEIAAEVTLKTQVLNVTIQSGAILRFKKRTGVVDTSSVVVGEGTFRLRLFCRTASFRIIGTIDIEAHNGSTAAGDQFYYRMAQGAIALIPADETGSVNVRDFQAISFYQGTITVGNNATFVVPGGSGTNNYGSPLAVYFRASNVTLTLGTSATESTLTGNRVLVRTYTPTSSTDANVSDLELCADANFLYRKMSGTIKKIAWTNF